jgi:hypothetical protein
MAKAHAAVGGGKRGRRYATQQINRSYAVLLASEFQGFCRDLHSECVAHIVDAIGLTDLRDVIRVELTRDRKLDRGNAQKGSLASDFGRLGVQFWKSVEAHNIANAARALKLEELNRWRNAIVHQDLDASKLGGTTVLRLVQVRQYRVACGHLARSFDTVMRVHVHFLTGKFPW